MSLTVSANVYTLLQASTFAAFRSSLGLGTGDAVSFAGVTSTGAVALSPANAAVVLSPTGTGVVTINPAAAGTLNNVVIGGSTPLAGSFTDGAFSGSVSVEGFVYKAGVGGISFNSANTLELFGTGGPGASVNTGFIFYSPDGNPWRVAVDNSGALTITDLAP